MSYGQKAIQNAERESGCESHRTNDARSRLFPPQVSRPQLSFFLLKRRHLCYIHVSLFTTHNAKRKSGKNKKYLFKIYKPVECWIINGSRLKWNKNERIEDVESSSSIRRKKLKGNVSNRSDNAVEKKAADWNLWTQLCRSLHTVSFPFRSFCRRSVFMRCCCCCWFFPRYSLFFH